VLAQDVHTHNGLLLVGRGTEVTPAVLVRPLHAQMYLILVTGRSSRADVVTGLEAGADDYLVKPVDLAELRARVQAGVRLIDRNVERERLLNSISSILIRVDAAGRVTRWNAAAEEIFGIEATTVLGRPLTDCAIAWSEPAVVHRLMDHPKGTARLDDLAFTDGDGRHRLVGLTITTMPRFRRVRRVRCARSRSNGATRPRAAAQAGAETRERWSARRRDCA
jgi:PAS domain S-box-containing protein